MNYLDSLTSSAQQLTPHALLAAKNATIESIDVVINSAQALPISGALASLRLSIEQWINAHL